MTPLQTYLDQNRLRQEVFAGLIGTTQATVSKLAKGLAMPSLRLAAAIERATGGQVRAVSWVEDEGAKTAEAEG